MPAVVVQLLVDIGTDTLSASAHVVDIVEESPRQLHGQEVLPFPCVVQQEAVTLRRLQLEGDGERVVHLQARQHGEGVHGLEGDRVGHEVAFRAESSRQLDVLHLPHPGHLEEEVVVEDELLHGANEAFKLATPLAVVVQCVLDVYVSEIKLGCSSVYFCQTKDFFYSFNSVVILTHKWFTK